MHKPCTGLFAAVLGSSLEKIAVPAGAFRIEGLADVPSATPDYASPYHIDSIQRYGRDTSPTRGPVHCA